ncbi:MAG: hypothetical protein SRB1_00516 [Desulfobacteraceae bacterium Eth-SRB1]|nr:MAG: hypothetical protein SRB1_00516 [Desulfobacteraceae bacterium Eth-SRB1]
MTASKEEGRKVILLDVCFLSFLPSQRPPIKPDCHFDSRNVTTQADRLKAEDCQEKAHSLLTPSAMPEACKLQSKQLQPDYVSSYAGTYKFYYRPISPETSRNLPLPF